MEKIYLPQKPIEVEKTDDVSDGYHTFGELYDHRITLFIALCKMHNYQPLRCSIDGKTEIDCSLPWKSKKHSDGELCFGGKWFIAGLWRTKGRQITYHLPIERWNECHFIEELDKAPKWDGHTPADVLERLKNL